MSSYYLFLLHIFPSNNPSNPHNSHFPPKSNLNILLASQPVSIEKMMAEAPILINGTVSDSLKKRSYME